MKFLLVLGTALTLAFAQSGIFDIVDSELCDQDPISIFRDDVLLPFNTRVASEANFFSGGHFIISSHTIWLSLASVAESLDSYNDEQYGFLKSLYLPRLQCIRDKIYPLALGLETPGSEFLRHRAIAIDRNLRIRPEWIEKYSGLLPYLSVDYSDEHFGRVQEYMGIEPKIELKGHSVFLDRLDFGSLWTHAFADNSLIEGPFYNLEGAEIAKVEYFRMRTRVRAADIPNYSIRVVELPVGSDGRYSMILAVGGEAKTMIEAVFNKDIFQYLKLTETAVDVAVPKLIMSSGLDLEYVLSNIGLGSVFTDDYVTNFISEPAALPMTYLQRVDVNMTGSYGRVGEGSDSSEEIEIEVREYFQYEANYLPEQYHFIANKPFLFSLYENNIRVPLFTGVYSYPDRRGKLIDFYRV